MHSMAPAVLLDREWANDIKLDLAAADITKIQQVWTAAGKIHIAANFQALCQDGKHLSVSRSFDK